jgi:hypothetical protein
MKRPMMLVTVLLVMMATLVLSPVAAMARPVLDPCFNRPPPAFCPIPGTPVPTLICDVVGKEAGIIGWRNGTLWVFHPAPRSF